MHAGKRARQPAGLRRVASQANPPRERLAQVRALLPSNPHLGFTKAHYPVSLLSLGSADLAVSARDLTTSDVVRTVGTKTPRGVSHTLTTPLLPAGC
jgi:hypothetical protein